jgi:hypothetical protein
MELKDGWFEEQEDGTRDYIAILENGEKWRLKNAYLTSVDFGGLQQQNGDELIEITLTQYYYDKPAVSNLEI